MKCFCCSQDKPKVVQIDFLGDPKFICEECEAIARRGQKPMPRVECARPWAMAIDRKKAAVGSLDGGK